MVVDLTGRKVYDLDSGRGDPGLALSITVYAVNMLGDALRDLLDPRLRGGVGRYGGKVKKKDQVKNKPAAAEGSISTD